MILCPLAMTPSWNSRLRDLLVLWELTKSTWQSTWNQQSCKVLLILPGILEMGRMCWWSSSKWWRCRVCWHIGSLCSQQKKVCQQWEVFLKGHYTTISFVLLLLIYSPPNSSPWFPFVPPSSVLLVVVLLLLMISRSF